MSEAQVQGTPADSAPRRRWFTSVRLWMSVSATLLGLTLFVTLPGYKLYWRREYDRRMAELRATGEPLTIEDVLATIPEVPREESAAFAFADAISEFRETIGPILNAVEAVNGDRLSPSQEGLLLRCFAQAEGAYQKALKASKLPSAGWRISVEDENSDRGRFTTEPDKYRTWPLRMALGSWTSLASAVGDTERAIQCIEIMRTMADMSPDYFFEDIQLRSMYDETVLSAVQDALSLHEFQDKDVIRMAQLIPPVRDPYPDHLRIMTRAVMLDTILLPAGRLGWDEEKKWQERWQILRARTNAWRTREFAAVRMLDYTDLLAESLQPVRDGVFTALPSAEIQLRGCIDNLIENWRHDSWFMQCIRTAPMSCRDRPSYFVPQIRRNVLSHLTARVALAAERYRLANGRWPGKAADLVPTYLQEEPFNPISGEPVEITPTHQGLRVWAAIDTPGVNKLPVGGWSTEELDVHTRFLSALDYGGIYNAVQDIDEFAKRVRVKVPVDPYTGIPLRIKKSQDTYTVYFERPGAHDIIVGEGNEYGIDYNLYARQVAESIVFDLLDPAHRRHPAISLREAMGPERRLLYEERKCFGKLGLTYEEIELLDAEPTETKPSEPTP